MNAAAVGVAARGVADTAAADSAGVAGPELTHPAAINRASDATGMPLPLAARARHPPWRTTGSYA